MLHRLENPRRVENYCCRRSDRTAFHDIITFRFSSFDDFCWIDEALPGIPNAPNDTVQSLMIVAVVVAVQVLR